MNSLKGTNANSCFLLYRVLHKCSSICSSVSDMKPFSISPKRVNLALLTNHFIFFIGSQEFETVGATVKFWEFCLFLICSLCAFNCLLNCENGTRAKEGRREYFCCHAYSEGNTVSSNGIIFFCRSSRSISLALLPRHLIFSVGLGILIIRKKTRIQLFSETWLGPLKQGWNYYLLQI